MIKGAWRSIAQSRGLLHGLQFQQGRCVITGLERYRQPMTFRFAKGLDNTLLSEKQSFLQDRQSTIHLFFRKAREMYHNLNTLPPRRVIFPSRMRVAEESVVDLHKNLEVAGCIRARDEFEDVDIVLPHKAAFTFEKAESPQLRQYLVRLPEGAEEEEILCTVQAIVFHERMLSSS